MIYRTKHNKDNPYFMMNRTAVHDDNLSFKAVGILTYLLSKPDDWTVQEMDLAQRHTDGTSAVRSGLQELRLAGYIKAMPKRDPLGKVIEWETHVFEAPPLAPVDEAEGDEETHNVENPHSGKPTIRETADIVSNDSLVSIDLSSNSSNGQSPKPKGPKKPDMNNLPQPPSLGEINRLWMNNIGPIGPIQAEMIEDLYKNYGGFEMDLAIRAAVTANARSMNYVQGTLKGRRNGSANHTSKQTSRNGSGRPAKTNGTGRVTQPALSADDAALMAEWAAANT